MKVLIINDLLIGGGAEMQGLREKQILERNGHEVFYLTFDESYSNKSNQYGKKENFFNIPLNRKGINSIRYKIFSSNKLKKQIIKKINEIKPDIIHLNNAYFAPSTQYKALKNYKVIQTIRDYSAVCPINTCIKKDKEICRGMKYNKCIKECGKDINTIIKILVNKRNNRERMKSINKYICPSKKLTKYCEDHGYNVKCINNPFDFEKFNNINKRVDFYKKKYLYYGNINKSKGIIELIDAFNEFSKNKDTCLFIAGKVEAEVNDRFYDLIKKNDKIIYLGYLKYSEMIKVLEEIYVIVVPSVWMENYPNTVLEGHATNTLVIGSNRGGIPEMLREREEFMFDVKLKQSIINTLNKSFNLTTKEYQYITEDNKKYVLKNNSIDKFYLELIKTFND